MYKKEMGLVGKEREQDSFWILIRKSQVQKT